MLIVHTPKVQAASSTLHSRDALNAGLEAMNAGKISEAAEFFLSAKTQAPGFGLAHLEWAIATHELEPGSNAVLSALRRAQALLKNNPRVQYYLGATLERQEAWDAAATAYTQALELRPGFRDAAFRRAVCLQSAESYEAAISVFQGVIAEAPAHLGAYAALATLYEKLGRLNDAELALLRVAELQPRAAYPRYQLALFYARAGNQRKARKMRERAQFLDPRPERKMRRLR